MYFVYISIAKYLKLYVRTTRLKLMSERSYIRPNGCCGRFIPAYKFIHSPVDEFILDEPVQGSFIFFLHV